MRCQDLQKPMQRDSHQPTSIQRRHGGTENVRRERAAEWDHPLNTAQAGAQGLRLHCPLPYVQVLLLSTTHTQTTGLMPSPSLGQVTDTQNIRNNRILRDDSVTSCPFSQMCKFPNDLLNRGLSIKHGHWDAFGNRELSSSSQSLAKQTSNPDKVFLP